MDKRKLKEIMKAIGEEETHWSRRSLEIFEAIYYLGLNDGRKESGIDQDEIDLDFLD